MTALMVRSLFAIGLLVSLAGCQPKNFDECVLGEMKDRPRAMLSYAEAACERRFPFEKDITLEKDKIGVEWSADGTLINLLVAKNSSSYEVTRVVASFSRKPCKRIDNEFSPSEVEAAYVAQQEFTFINGSKASSSRLTPSDTNDDAIFQFICMRTDAIYGRHAKD